MKETLISPMINTSGTDFDKALAIATSEQLRSAIQYWRDKIVGLEKTIHEINVDAERWRYLRDVMNKDAREEMVDITINGKDMDRYVDYHMFRPDCGPMGTKSVNKS